MISTTITAVRAREILDSRGKPTLEVSVECEEGHGVFGVPSGASTGTHEALELRDGDKSHYDGQGVLKAATHVNVNLAGALIGMDARDQRALDARMIEMDGTPDKSKLGGNAIVGISVATARAAASATKTPLHEYLYSLAPDIKSTHRMPFLCMNLINGGKHAATRVAFQEYKIVPQTQDIQEALQIGTNMMNALKKRIAKEYGAVNANVGDEGGFAPDLDSVRRPLELLMETAAELNLDHKIKLAMDVAASSFYIAGEDRYEYDGGNHTTAELETTLRGMMRDFPLLYIEDLFHETAFADFVRMNALRETQDKTATIIVGDDLTVTNSAILQKAISGKAISGIIIKVNQVGTLTETLDTMKLARDNNIECIVSHRSGETNDDFIADLAVAFGVFGIKAGGPQRGERVAKYNRLAQLLS
ncbi:MAG: phosphopyruvate hydratase [Patescibacteria group bacterium]